MNKILIFLLIIFSYTVFGQVKTDPVQAKSQNAINGLSSKVPELLVTSITSDSVKTIKRRGLCESPYGLFIIDDKQVPCDSVVSLKVENIEDIKVLNLSETHELYGNKGDPYGAIVFITKRYAAKLKSNQIKKP